MKLHDLPKVTQLLNVGVGVKVGFLTPRAASFIGFPKQVIEVPSTQSNQGEAIMNLKFKRKRISTL